MIRFLILTFLLLAGFVGTYFSDRGYINEQFEKDHFYRRKAQDQNTYSLVIGGDSRALYGIDPKTITDELGLNSGMNFAFLSNSYTPEYIDYLKQRMKEDSVVILPLTYESLTNLEVDKSFQTAKADKKNFIKKISQLIEFTWPGSKITKPQQDHSFGKEIYSSTGEIDRFTGQSTQTQSLTNHYQHVLENFKIERAYLESMKSLIQAKPQAHFVLFHICFLKKICPQELNHIKAIFTSFQSFPNVSIVVPEGKFVATDGDHLDLETQIEYSKLIAQLIKRTHSP